MTVYSLDVLLFLVSSCFFNDSVDVGNLISGSSAFSKTSLNIWKFTVHILLKPGLENFKHYFASMWDECNCVVVWAFFSIVFLWDWNENCPFPVLWSLLSFPNLNLSLSVSRQSLRVHSEALVCWSQNWAPCVGISSGSIVILWFIIKMYIGESLGQQKDQASQS